VILTNHEGRKEKKGTAPTLGALKGGERCVGGGRLGDLEREVMKPGSRKKRTVDRILDRGGGKVFHQGGKKYSQRGPSQEIQEWGGTTEVCVRRNTSSVVKGRDSVFKKKRLTRGRKKDVG